MQASVAGEIGRHLRAAMGCEVGRSRHKYHAGGAEAAGDQARIPQPADTDRNVEAFLHRIDDAVRERKLNSEVRIADHEIGQHAAQAARPERHGRVDPQAAFGLVVQARDLRFRLLHFGQNGEAALVVGKPGFGRRDAAGGAVEQAGAEIGFQLGDRFADGRARDAKLSRRFREARRSDDLRESVHRGKLVHIASI